MPLRALAVLISFIGSLSALAAGPPPDVYSTDYWQIAGEPSMVTWIEIHNREEAPTSGVAHVEVLARKRGAPVWEVEHVCGHLAVTTAALQRSVLRPYRTGSVYPETFITAYQRWRADEQKGAAAVCSTTIQDVLPRR